jgi:hypothetical protein
METLKGNRSVFNPTDMSMMAQEGEITPDMPIREYFAKLGVDVDGPISQLVEMAKGQMQKADPLNKMKAIAGGPQQGMPPQGQPPQAPQGRVPQQAPGMGGLLKQM